MLIPLHDGRLLLPSAAVAEVIGYRTPDPVADAPGWLQGTVNWHQREIPVIDFERLMGLGQVGAGIRQRIAVCYATGTGLVSPLFGLVAQGIPRLLHIQPELIEQASARAAGERVIRMTLGVAGESLMVPDMDYINSKLSSSLAAG